MLTNPPMHLEFKAWSSPVTTRKGAFGFKFTYNNGQVNVRNHMDWLNKPMTVDTRLLGGSQ